MTSPDRSPARPAAAGPTSRLLPVLTTGLVAGLLEITLVVSFAALVFSGDLSAFVGHGIGLVLLASLINIT